MSNSKSDKLRAQTKEREKAFRAVNEIVMKMNNCKSFKKLPEFQKMLRRVMVTGTRGLWTLKQNLENLYKKVKG
jgi:hypothetical protein